MSLSRRLRKKEMKAASKGVQERAKLGLDDPKGDTAANANAENSEQGTSSKLPMILGIAGAVVVLIVVIIIIRRK
jgi:hypothetical protein